MKRLALYILLIVLVGESTNLCQLAKLPILYEHYHEHKERNPQVSFLKFLSMHYWGDDMDDDDDERDSQLPFKSSDTHAASFLYFTLNRAIEVKPGFSWIPIDFGPDRPEFYFNPAGQSLFRPPRV